MGCPVADLTVEQRLWAVLLSHCNWLDDPDRYPEIDAAIAAIRAECEADRDRRHDCMNVELERAEAEHQRLRKALIRVRAHTSYVNPSVDLLAGLLASVQRIVDAALEGVPRG